MIGRPIVLFLFFLQLSPPLSLLLRPITAAQFSTTSVASSYRPYQYDMTIPQFTPDGRLLQVEYAQSASDHSTPIVAAILDHDLAILVTHLRNPQQEQERLVILPATTTLPNYDDPITTSPQPTIVVALSGVLADSLWLLQLWTEYQWQQHRLYNGKRPITASRVAGKLAQWCHTNALSGGRRVFGSTMFIVSSTRAMCMQPTLILYKTDPSGCVHEIHLNHQSCENRFVILGGDTVKTKQLQRKLEQDWLLSLSSSSTRKANNSPQTTNDTEQQDDTIEALQQYMGQLLNIVSSDENTNIRKDSKSAESLSSLSAQPNKDAANAAVAGTPPTSSTVTADDFEVVLLSATKGCIKLSKPQIQHLLQKGRGVDS